MIGYPTDAATVRASVSDAMGSSVPGTDTTPYFATARLASIFEPISAIDAAEGPMNVIPASSQALENEAFSARKPYPG